MDDNEANTALFHDVVFSIIPSDDIDFQQESALNQILFNHGARRISLIENKRDLQRLDELTHIITTDIDFPQYTAALENGIHVVRPSWVITSANKKKQAQPRQHSPDPSQYFRDVVLTTADLPEGDKDAIIAGVIALGGQYSGTLSKLCTHLVTNDDDNEKCRVAQEKAPKCKVVLPHWFNDCFRLGRMINERPYMFPDPEIRRSADDLGKVLGASSSTLSGATAAVPTGPLPSQPASSPPARTEVRENLNALMCRKILLSNDLQLSDDSIKNKDSIRATLIDLINRAGGTITKDVEECDIYIGHYRDGKDYVKASRAGKIVANLSWLYHVLNRNKYTNPLAKLLHYPIPRDGLRGFEGMVISISNYSGDARIYLENLIKYAGAEFTKTMKQDNTHLITAHMASEKCEAAQEWGINVVNHIWLEESYAKCAVQTLTNPRYTHFPARTNLGEVTGQTSFDMKRVEQTFFPKPRESPQKTALPSPGKTMSSNVPQGATSSPFTLAADDEMDDEQTPTMKKPRGRPPKSTGTPRVRENEKENESPLLQGSGRASKLKAASLLHRQADDIALFQKEMKRKGGVTHGGRRGSNAEDFSSPAVAKDGRKKRTSDEASFDVSAELSELSDGETQAQPMHLAKRAKNTGGHPNLPAIEYRMLVSGDERWLGKADKESRDRAKLRQLGVLLVTEPKDIDILVAPRILRTRKFVCALAFAPRVVDSSFLDVALRQNILVSNPPPLTDPETEERLGFRLANALERAKINNRKLLRGWSIFVTKDIKGGFDTYKDIISINGGDALLYAGRIGYTLPKRRLGPEKDEGAGEESQHQGGEEELDFVYLVSGTSEAEVKLWKMFRALAEKQGLKARVVSTDWLLDAAMSQRVEWKDEYLVEEGPV